MITYGFLITEKWYYLFTDTGPAGFVIRLH